jgi:glycosyltransferase involved in cell wall biosynthesis
MKVTMFTSWQVRCGIASYAAHLVDALNNSKDIAVQVVPFDRERHPRADYHRWGAAMNAGDVAHIQHEYSFFGYLTPWQNHFDAFVTQIQRPLVITRHVTFDGPLMLPGRGPKQIVRRLKWSLYNRWLGPYATYLNRDIFTFADQIIVLSARLKTHLVARGIDPQCIHIIPAGAPDVPPPTGGREVRARLGWLNRRVLGVFGYITPVKGHVLAVEALRYLPADTVLLIAGGVRRPQDRDVLEALHRKIQQFHLQDRVHITGYLDEGQVPAHIDACDLLLYPATHADSSYSLVTGIAYRRAAIVASDVFGHREVAEQGAGVALFPNGDVQALVQVISRLLDDPAWCNALVEQASTYLQRFSWPAIAQMTSAVYREAVHTFKQRGEAP